MTTKELTAFRIDPSVLRGLRQLKERDGIAISDQVRQAIQDWLAQHHAAPGEVDRVFDDFEDSLSTTDDLCRLRLGRDFGDALAARQFGSLTKGEMESLDRFAKAAGRPTRSYWDFWRKAVRQRHEREQRRNMELAKMSDDEIRQELFDELVGRLQLQRQKDPSLIVQERAPMLCVLSRNGHLAQIDRGTGPRLMRGVIKWRPGLDEDEPHRFSVRRSTDRKRLALKPGPEGNLDVIVDDIVTTFLKQTE